MQNDKYSITNFYLHEIQIIRFRQEMQNVIRMALWMFLLINVYKLLSLTLAYNPYILYQYCTRKKYKQIFSINTMPVKILTSYLYPFTYNPYMLGSANDVTNLPNLS